MFVSQLAPKLLGYRQKSEFLWNFKCPICGDSHKNKLKMRGYIYRRKADLCFACHNCGSGMSMGNFLKLIDPSLYSQYQMERFKNESSGNTKKPDFSMVMQKPIFNIKKKIDLPSIDTLDDKHSAKHYVKDRKIPKERWSELYYANDFAAFVKDIHPTYDKYLYDEPRLVIPFYDEDKKLLGFQGRALITSKIKYITIKFDEDNKKVFGLDKVDKSKRIYIVEGPIDSMFLENSLAMMDATLYNVIHSIGDHQYTFIYDNEPRNGDICKHMKKTISLGKDVCIWPAHIKSKDINDMVKLNGMSTSMIRNIIDDHTFNGLRATMEFNMWRKL